MKHTFWITFILSCSLSTGYGQIKGKIYTVTFSGEDQVLQNAKLSAHSLEKPLFSDEQGRFEFVLLPPYYDTLIVEKAGYLTDTIFLTPKDRFTGLALQLYAIKQLQETTVTAVRSNKHIDRLNPLLIERIGIKELRKAACCNLSESFETNATADVSTTDAVSGTKKIQLLGLDGNYTHFQLENRTIINGLSRANGILAYPGAWFSGIDLSKGGGSVTTSHSSISGSVNINLPAPHQMDKLSVNLYENSIGRSELNVNGMMHLNPKWEFSHFEHISGLWTEVDRNKDGFRDTPLTKTISLLHRFTYAGKKLEAQLGWEVYQDERSGGQLRRFPSRYAANIQNKHAVLFAKTGFLFPKHPTQSLGVIYQFKGHQSDLHFGPTYVRGKEYNGSITTLYTTELGSPVHTLTSGTEAEINASSILWNNTSLPVNYTKLGVYSEYTFQGKRFTAVIGGRIDALTSFQPIASPRLHLKYTLSEKNILRVTSGRTWRLPFMVTDNQGLLATAKSWILPSDLLPEIAWNTGISFQHDSKIKGKPFHFISDVYWVQFEQQLVIDREVNPSAFVFNYQNNTQSIVSQTEFNFTPQPRFDIRLAYKFVHSVARYDGRIQQQLFTAKHRTLLNLGYKTRNRKWEFDLTGSVNTGMRLTEHQSHLHPNVLMPQLLGQVTHHFKTFDVYLGGENLTNYTQSNPIEGNLNPFGTTFDATNVYGPLLGTIVYAGLRMNIKQKK